VVAICLSYFPFLSFRLVMYIAGSVYSQLFFLVDIYVINKIVFIFTRFSFILFLPFSVVFHLFLLP